MNRTPSIWLFCLALLAASASAGVTVTLVAPANATSTSAANITFNYTPTNNGTYVNATLFTNFTGAFAANFSNASTIVNASAANVIVVNGTPEGFFIWNVNVSSNETGMGAAVGPNNFSFAPANFTLIIDRTVPVVTLNTPAAGTVTADNTPDFSFTATDNLDGSLACTVTAAGVATGPAAAANATATTITSATLPNGATTWSVSCTDDAGNTGVSATRTITIDSGGAGAPQILNVRHVISDTPSEISVTILWDTNEVTNAQVEFGTSGEGSSQGALNTNSTLNTTLALNHSVQFRNLYSGTTYSYRVNSCDSAGFCNRSDVRNFSTAARGGGGGGGGGGTIAPAPLGPTPMPTPTPTPAPTPTVIPVATPTPSPTPQATAQPPQTMSVNGGQVQAQQSLQSGAASSFSVRVRNAGAQPLRNVEVRQRIPNEVAGPFTTRNPDDYLVRWNPRPVRIEPGSILAVWSISALAPGESAELGFSVDKRLDPSLLAQFGPAQVGPAATPTPLATPRATPLATPAAAATPAPVAAGPDYALIGIIVPDKGVVVKTTYESAVPRRR